MTTLYRYYYIVVLPPSALGRLAHLEIELPMVFKLTNTALGNATHSGVLEFVAEEGRMYMPHWVSLKLWELIIVIIGL